MGRIRKATLDRAFGGSPTCTGPHPISRDFRNGFVCDYLKQRELVSFGNRKAAVTPRLESWLGLSMTERFRDMVSFALRHILHDSHTITALTGLLGEIPAGTGFDLIKLGYFLHADTMAPGGFSRIESRLMHFLDVLTKLGFAAFINERYVLTNTGEALFRGNQHPLDENVSTTFMTQPNFEIILGPEIDMQVRFTLEILAERRNRDMVLTYEVTRDGIARARERGMSTEEIITFFEKHTRNTIPQNVQFSIESWAKSYGQHLFRRHRAHAVQGCQHMRQCPSHSRNDAVYHRAAFRYGVDRFRKAHSPDHIDYQKGGISSRAIRGHERGNRRIRR